MKIKQTIKLQDGQRIHVMGSIHPIELNEYMRDCYRSYEYTNERDFVQRESHYALRRYIQHQCDELSDWLAENNCETTNWVNPKIFDELTYGTGDFAWGIGFRHNDLNETIFTLRWS